MYLHCRHTQRPEKGSKVTDFQLPHVGVMVAGLLFELLIYVYCSTEDVELLPRYLLRSSSPPQQKKAVSDIS